MPEQTFKRRTYFIKKAFQVKIIMQIILLLVIGSAISGFLLYFLASNELQANLSSAHMTITNTWDILLPSILFTQITVVLLISMATIYVILYLSHKIAGPLYKFEKVAEEIGEGNFSVHIGLRDKDELVPLQNAFQKMIDNLKDKIIKFDKGLEEFKAIENNLQNAVNGSKLSDEDKQALIAELQDFSSTYAENVKRFKL